MAVSAIKWETAPTFSNAHTSAAVADAAGGLGPAIANNTALDIWAAFHFTATPAVAPGAGKSLKCYLLMSDDAGTTWERGTTSIQPDRAPDFVVALANINSAHEIVVQQVMVPPLNYKLLIWNDSGQSVTVAAEVAPYNRESQ